MRTIKNFEYDRIKAQFESVVVNLAAFSIAVQYYRASYYSGPGGTGTFYPEVNSTWIEPGFFGQFTNGEAVAIQAGTTGIIGADSEFSVTPARLKVPSRYFNDGFRVLNPNAPAEALNKRFDMGRSIVSGSGGAVSGIVNVTGIILNRLYGKPASTLSETSYAIISKPKEYIDGVVFELKGTTISGASVYPNYVPPSFNQLYSLAARFGPDYIFQRYGVGVFSPVV